MCIVHLGTDAGSQLCPKNLKVNPPGRDRVFDGDEWPDSLDSESKSLGGEAR